MRALLGVPAHVLSAAFATLDTGAFVVQFVGGVTAEPMTSTEKLRGAIHIYMGGIGLQQFFIVVLVSSAVRFHIEAIRDGHAGRGVFGGFNRAPEKLANGSRSDARKDRVVLSSWSTLMYALYFTLTMVPILIVYRFAEMSSGTTVNSLTTSETYLYVLEAAPMVLALLAFAVVYPGMVLESDEVDDEMSSLCGTMRKKVACCGRDRKVEDCLLLSSLGNSDLLDQGFERADRQNGSCAFAITRPIFGLQSARHMMARTLEILRFPLSHN